MNLHAMRDLNRADPLGGLGPRVERNPEAAPAAPEPVGVYTGPDGKMRTNLPLPPGPATPPIWPFPTHPPLDTTTEEPGAHGFLRPLKVGDLIKHHMNGVIRVVAIRNGDAIDCEGSPNLTNICFEGRYWERVA